MDTLLNYQAGFTLSRSLFCALKFADFDGDGIQDFVAGKRFWAHGSDGDPEPNGEAVCYGFRNTREAGSARFAPFKIDGNSGAGTQINAGDLNGDGWPDVVVGNKKGAFAFIRDGVTPKPSSILAKAQIAKLRSLKGASFQGQTVLLGLHAGSKGVELSALGDNATKITIRTVAGRKISY